MHVTVVVPTFNRARALEQALPRLIAARESAPCECEIIVVDNNSTDTTASVVARFAVRVRYVFEPRQGLSHARNAGIAAAGADLATDHIVAFTDDDVEVAPDWIAGMVREFARNPDVAFRRGIFERIGTFPPAVQRIRDSIGSTEDHELPVRLYGVGERALHVPEIVVWATVPPDRLTRRYHRRRHRGHGRFYARMRLPDMERSRKGRVRGVPAHLFRSAAGDAAAWLPLAIAGDASAAFERETRLWFLSGFVRERCAWLTRH